MRGKILVVEDEQTIRDFLAWSLSQEGFEVVLACNGSEAIERFTASPPDLVLLDLMLGKDDGLDVLRTLRRDANVPIIVVTARDDEADKISGLELGADDYVTKPFSARELVARIRANLRKSQPSQRPMRVRLGEVEIDWGRAEMFREDVRVFLTAREFDVLRSLYDHRDRVLSREWLLEHVWGVDYDGDDRVVDTTIKRLRKKLQGDLIETVRGLGYRLIR